jgi:hypothetical protein
MKSTMYQYMINNCFFLFPVVTLMSNMATGEEEIELQSSPLMDSNEKNKSETGCHITHQGNDWK